MVGIVRQNLIQEILLTVNGIRTLHTGCLLHIVLGNIAQQLLDKSDTLLLGAGSKVCHTALGRVNAGTAQLLLSNHLAQYSLDRTGAGKEHIACILNHNRKVSQRGTIDSTAGTGAHDSADLGDNTASHDVTLEDLGITGKGIDTLLQTRTA